MNEPNILEEREIQPYDSLIAPLQKEREGLMVQCDELWKKMSKIRAEKMEYLLNTGRYYPLSILSNYAGQDIGRIVFLLEDGGENEYSGYSDFASITEDGHFDYSSEAGLVVWNDAEGCYDSLRYGYRRRLPFVGIVSIEFQEAEKDE